MISQNNYPACLRRQRLEVGDVKVACNASGEVTKVTVVMPRRVPATYKTLEALPVSKVCDHTNPAMKGRKIADIIKHSGEESFPVTVYFQHTPQEWRVAYLLASGELGWANINLQMQGFLAA